MAVLGSAFFELLPGEGFAEAIRWLIILGVGCYAVSFVAAFLLPRAARADGGAH